ncbi:MAG: glycosyltransferase family 4 protein [Asticcacaulis sp.]
MSVLKALPLRYRLPLIHGTLGLIGKWRARNWLTADNTRLRKGPIIVSAFYNEAIGIGRGGQLTADAIAAAGYDIIRHDLRPCFGHIRDQKAQLPGENAGVWLIHANAPEALVALISHSPDQWSQRYRIGFWAWETPKAPDDWVWLAALFHEIWVPSRFVRDALATAFHSQNRSELCLRLRVMPHPFPPKATATTPQRERFGLKSGLCHTLTLFDSKSSAARKNPWAALEAWQKAFPEPSDTACLTIKIQGLSDDPQTRSRLETMIGDRQDMRLFTERLSDADMDSFVASFDIVLSLHRSEGFGLSLLEAMMSGIPVIATGWSGNTDFMTADNSRTVGYSLIPIDDRHGAYSALKPDPAQVWADANTDDAAQALRELCSDAERRRILGTEARKVAARVNAPWSHQALYASLTPWDTPPKPL